MFGIDCRRFLFPHPSPLLPSVLLTPGMLLRLPGKGNETTATQATLCKEPKPKECPFKFMERNIVTKRELFRYGIQSNDDYIYLIFS